MAIDESDAQQVARQEEERLSARAMGLLTFGLTEEGDAFLIGVGAVVLFACFYPLTGAWALVAFPAVLLVAVVVRTRLRRRG